MILDLYSYSVFLRLDLNMPFLNSNNDSCQSTDSNKIKPLNLRANELKHM